METAGSRREFHIEDWHNDGCPESVSIHTMTWRRSDTHAEIASTVINPTGGSNDETTRIQLLDAFGKGKLWVSLDELAPALVVNDLLHVRPARL